MSARENLVIAAFGIFVAFLLGTVSGAAVCESAHTNSPAVAKAAPEPECHDSVRLVMNTATRVTDSICNHPDAVLSVKTLKYQTFIQCTCPRTGSASTDYNWEE